MFGLPSCAVFCPTSSQPLCGLTFDILSRKMKQMKNKIVSACLPSFILCSIFLLMSPVKAQPPDRSALIDTIEKKGCAVTEDGKVKICKFDYKYKNKTVEALTSRPNTDGKFPSLFLIPGYNSIRNFSFSVVSESLPINS